MTHGTLSGYVQHKCRCEECSTVMRKYNKRRRYLVSNGHQLTVDAAPVHAHIRTLLDGGMSFKAITSAAGYRSRNSLTSILEAKRVRRVTAERVLAIRPESDVRAGRYVDATGTRRRLQALARMGYPTSDLATRIGRRDDTTLLDIRRGMLETIRRSTAMAVAGLYDELWSVEGPSARTRGYAIKQGWPPPLAWDDDRIDDPTAGPADWQRPPDTGRGRDRSELIEDYLDTFEYHQGDLMVASVRLGVSHMALTQVMYRARRDGVDVPFHHVSRH